MRNFEREGNRWLELSKKFILASNQAKIVAQKGNLEEKREFLKRIGSNLILLDRNIKYFPRSAWKILENLPNLSAERRRREAQKDINFSKIPVWLRGQDSNLQPSA